MTNVARWNNAASLSPDWAARAQFISRLLPPGLSVLDIGCGGMDVERFVSPKEYIPVDIAARDGRTIVLDLNAEPLPEDLLARPDVVVALGVLEYVEDVDRVLAAVARAGKPFLFTYCVVERNVGTDRRADDWINDFTEADLTAKARAAGFDIVQRLVFNGAQLVLLACPKGERPTWLQDQLSAKAENSSSGARASARPSIVLAGFFGRGNCGDEALLQCIYESFADEYDVIVSVNEHGAHRGFWDWYPYSVARRTHQMDGGIFARLPRCVGLVVGGGSLDLGFAANLALPARAAGAATVLAGVDGAYVTGKSPAQESVGQSYLALFDLVAFRTQTGERPPEGVMAAATARQIPGADWALRLEADRASDVVVDRKKAFVTLREFPIGMTPYAYIEGVGEIVRALRANGYAPTFLPFCPEDERFLSETGLDMAAPSERCWWNPRRMKQVIGSGGMMVSVSRLHPIIFAAGVGVDVVSMAPPGIDAPKQFGRAKILAMADQLGIASVDDVAGLERFLRAPRPADPVKHAQARARLDAMVGQIRALLAERVERGPAGV